MGGPMWKLQKHFGICIPVFIFITLIPCAALAAVAWLDEGPDAIWGKSSGFYKEGDQM